MTLLHLAMPRSRPTVAASALSSGTRANALLAFVAFLVLVGLLSVVAHRFRMQKRSATSETSMTRPVLAALLVGTLLLLATASLTSDESETRNLLVGGVVSLSSAAAAFYFASSGATEARRDLIAATSVAQQVPELVGKTLRQAEALVSALHLSLVTDGAPGEEGAAITAQEPPAGTLARGPQSVVVHF